ncbi:hypothetical protein KSP39_PZI024118 [Platanthera zijinensis]|uniref:DUF659 domain-containing protein n=1 Tax=Platanthera zijinensis TaxID=2320716 RepID=A0AAP0ATS9_9ASPA
MKQHLAGVKGNIAACKKVSHDIRNQMLENLKEISTKKQEKQESFDSVNPYGDPVSDERTSSITKTQQSSIQDKGKRKLDQVENYFAPRTSAGSQPSLKSVLASKEAVHRADMCISRWFFDSCIPINALNSAFAQKAIDAIASIGPGYKLPSYHMMRTNLLRDCKEECRLLIDSYRECWRGTGCTLMADGWTDKRSRTLINFLVYSSRGVSFYKSVDASDITKDATNLCMLFSEVVEWIGPSSIVQIITDNAANYKKAGELLHQKYGNIYWSPCAAHCLNLVLKDIGNLSHVSELAKNASKVTVFVYNHIFLLSWLRKREGWREIIRPGATRFATTFITLKSIYDHKHDLQALVTSKYYTDSKLAKLSKGKDFVAVVLDNNFWNMCLIMTRVAGPLIRLLRIVDSDEKPSIGYVYDGMYRARKAIKGIFKNVKRLYKPYTTIIKDRWDRQLRQRIHSAAYFLNPAFQYDQTNYSNKPEVVQGLIELIGNKDICNKASIAMNEVRIYRDQLESFGKSIAIKMSKEMQPGKYKTMST